MIICVVGPTGSGKTKISIELAKQFDAIIINCDASQIYREMNIATAKITEEEKENIPHFLFNIKDFNEDYTVYDYQADCRKIIEANRDKNIVIVGGTGLYLKAALYDYQFGKEKEYDIDLNSLTNEELLNKVIALNPVTDIHVNNRQRLISYLSHEHNDADLTQSIYNNVHIIGITMDRDKLYERINRRVDMMLDQGLVQEAKYFYDKHVVTKSLETVIGYKELFKYFDNELSLEEAVSLIKQKSRRYAKRQYTWFKHQLPTVWYQNNQTEEIIKDIKNANN